MNFIKMIKELFGLKKEELKPQPIQSVKQPKGLNPKSKTPKKKKKEQSGRRKKRN